MKDTIYADFIPVIRFDKEIRKGTPLPEIADRPETRRPSSIVCGVNAYAFMEKLDGITLGQKLMFYQGIPVILSKQADPDSCWALYKDRRLEKVNVPDN